MGIGRFLRKHVFQLAFLALAFFVPTFTFAYDASYYLGQPDSGTTSAGLSQTKLSGPMDVMYIPSTQQLFIMDRGNSRLIVYDLSGGVTTGMPASLVAFPADFDTAGAGSGILGNAALVQMGMAYDSDTDNFLLFTYVADIIANAINDNGAYVNIQDQIDGVTHDRDFYSNIGSTYYDGHFFLADTNLNAAASSNRVMVLDATDGFTEPEEAVYVIGQSNFTNVGTGGELESPYSVVVDEANEILYVFQGGDSCFIKGFDISNLSGNITTADYSLGAEESDCSTIDGSAPAWYFGPGLVYPHLAFDQDNGVLFYQDNFNDGLFGLGSVEFFDVSDPDNASEYPFAVLGSASSAFEGVAFDSQTNTLFISETNNNRVIVYELIMLTSGTDLPDADTSTAYDENIDYIHDQGTVTFALQSGTLPPGLTLNADGSITGTPTSDGTYTFTVRATDVVSAGEQEFFDTKEFSITVGEGDVDEENVVTAIPGGNGGAIAPNIVVQGGISRTNTRNIWLEATYAPNVTTFEISNTPDFLSKKTYRFGDHLIPWDLCFGTSCQYGDHHIYARFYFQGNLIVQKELIVDYNKTCPYFFGYAKLGNPENSRTEVGKIQSFLNDYMSFDLPVDGVFGQKTYQAVKLFQEMFPDEIIKPWMPITGLKTSTGWWFIKTSEQANHVVGCDVPPVDLTWVHLG